MLKRNSKHRCFSVKFSKFLRTSVNGSLHMIPTVNNDEIYQRKFLDQVARSKGV